jgi:hypothetical protein
MPRIRGRCYHDDDERLARPLHNRFRPRWTDEIIEGDAVLELSSIGVEISLDIVYEDTELNATRLREDERQAPAL